MIASFGDRMTEDLFHGRTTRRVHRVPADTAATVRRKLDIVNSAKELLDLRAPPGNRLELLRGDLRGYHSIRVNEQWRIVFRWQGGNAYDVRMVDYHGG